MWPVLAKRRSKKTKRIFCCNKLNRRPIADKDIVLEKSALSVNSTGLQDNAAFFREESASVQANGNSTLLR